MVSEAWERAGIIKAVLVVAQAIQPLHQEPQIDASNRCLKKIIRQLPR
jgi:hypothetical protein